MEGIKCRFWDKELHRWSHSFPCVFPTEKDGITSRFDVTEGYEIVFYTGLKDKNGKEIYEGDIVRVIFFDGKTDNFQVLWDDGRARFNLVDKRNDWWGFTQDNDMEIIGNIYENPELIR